MLMSLLRNICAAVVAAVVACMTALSTALPPKAVVIGTPQAQAFTQEQILSQSIWDMTVCDGVLYVGGGDYSANTGPVTVWAYDLKTETWESSGVLQEEAVSRFVTVEDRVFAPGIDPSEGTWEKGNYHELTEGTWSSFNQLPGAVHNFDIARYEDKYFFALGTSNAETAPILVSADGQTAFAPVPVYKDGTDLLQEEGLRHIRAYDFLQVKDDLYCFLVSYYEDSGSVGFYKYEQGAFVYVSDAGELTQIRCKQLPVCEKVTVGDSCYFSTGTLYKTGDFTEFTQVDVPDGGVVTDLLAETEPLTGRQELYVLSNAKNEDGTVTATIWHMGETATKVAGYTSDCVALSFVRAGWDFYLGFSAAEGAQDSGAVVRLGLSG